MRKERAKELIDKLLREIEEEDVGIGLFSIFSQNPEDLKFFKDNDRDRLLQIIKILSEDSKRHKGILGKVIKNLGQKHHEK